MNQTLTKYAFIWDLDGTLINSYDEIMASTMQTLEEYGIFRDREEVYKDCIKTSVTQYLRETSVSNCLPADKVNRRFHEIHEARFEEVTLAPHAEEILAWLTEQGIHNYVFTHRESSMNPVLNYTGITHFFEEAIGIDGRFPRKPAPDALLYLAEKYRLDLSHTFYVGDRTVDMACAANAGMKKIFYKPSYSVGIPDGTEDYFIHDLLEIKEILN